MSATEAISTNDVQEYYGKVLQGTKDLKTNVCTVGKLSMPKHVKDALKQVHEEVVSKYYGCGLIIPDCLEGTSVLDLGSGAGQDCYVLSKLVGENGNVTGIDMTDEQLETARKYIQYHTDLFGFKKPNVDFVHGYIEKLNEAGLKDNSFDIIVSNCVVNLSPDKKAVLREAYRVLKEGGELYFSDVYADRDLPDEVRKHKVLWGECVAGALWWKDLVSIAEEMGFARPRIVSASEFDMGSKEFNEILGDAKFVSVTYRLFKLPNERLPATSVIYDGEIEGAKDSFKLDYGHVFKTGDVVCVDSEISTILQKSRFKNEFTIQPATKKSCGDNTSCCSEDKFNIVDPFQYVKEIGNDEAGCCGSSSEKSGCC